MKLKKFTYGLIGTAFLAFTFSSCGEKTEVNKSNSNNANAAVLSNSKPAIPPATNVEQQAKEEPSTMASNETKGDYMVGDVKCSIKSTDDLGVKHEVKCDGEDKATIYFRDDDPSKKQAILVSQDEKSKFVLDIQTASDGTFTDVSGKASKVRRVK